MSRVIVLGSINMDIVALAERHPAIGETVPGSALHHYPGGKGANQALASAKQGVDTQLVGLVGKDKSGQSLINFLTEQGVNVAHVGTVDGVTSGTAVIVVAASENTIVVVPGANGEIKPNYVDSVEVQSSDVLVSQFEVPLPAIQHLFERGREVGAMNILNPAPALACTSDLLSLVDILVLNETELAYLTGESHAISEIHVEEHARKLSISPTQTVVVTLGARGAIAVSNAQTVRVEGKQVDAVDTTGAGDCFVGVLAARFSAGDSLESALEYANAAAALCVQRPGAGPSMPTAAEVEKSFHSKGEVSP